MLKYLVATIGITALFLSVSDLFAQEYRLDYVTTMPEPVTNNAVAVANYNGNTFLYSFGGLDASKVFSGIHLRSFCYDVNNAQWITLPPLPDTLGKVAAGATYYDGIVYVIGGYHVFSNGSEASSLLVHRLDVATNTWLSDGANIPVPIDDHVQALWKDSLIYVVTGWSNTGNVSNVQIYDPTNDVWLTGTAVPNNNTYRSFGPSGTIVGDTLYYLGGASMGGAFPAQNQLRKGYIDPNSPTSIAWSFEVPTANSTCYRCGAFAAYHPLQPSSVVWVGGSDVTYNYNGIAYNGTGGVPPREDLWVYAPSNGQLSTQAFTNTDHPTMPMDLRNMASATQAQGDPAFYFMGGMVNNQVVSDSVLRLEASPVGITETANDPFVQLQVVPNPASGHFTLKNLPELDSKAQLRLFHLSGQLLREYPIHSSYSVEGLPSGVYLIELFSEGNVLRSKVVVD